MFDLDVFGKMQPLKIYLCRPDKTMICLLNGIDVEDVHLEINFNNQYSLSFSYLRNITTDTGKVIESNGYSMLDVGIYLFVEKVGFFRMQYPTFSYQSDSTEVKNVQAYSIDCELEYKDLSGFKINTGEEDSLEYLVVYEDGETESLINAYTNLPYDYILFYDRRNIKLREILGKYSDGKVTSQTAIEEISSLCNFIPRLKNKVTTDADGKTTLEEYVIYTYDSDGGISSLTLNNFNKRVQTLIRFYDKYRKQLSLLELAIEKCGINWEVGDIDETLADKKFQFNVDNQNIYSFLTQDVATVSECMVDFDIINRKINIVPLDKYGEFSGVNVSRINLLNSFEVSCDENSLFTRYNVSGADNLGINYVNFGLNRIDDISYFLHAQDQYGKKVYATDDLMHKYEQFEKDRELAREEYIRLSREYNEVVLEISEINYRMPDDFLSTDYSQYTLEELEGLRKVYAKLLATLISLYKEDYGTAGLNPDGSVNEDYMKNTEYWYDYYAYNNILDQINAAGEAWAEGKKYRDIDSEILLKKINAWKTEWSLYGIVELDNKTAAYDNSLKILLESSSVVLKDTLTKEIKKWSELSDNEKSEYSNLESNYHYNEYKEVWDNMNSAQEYLDGLKTELAILELSRDSVQEARQAIAKYAKDIYGYDREKLSEYVVLDSSDYGNNFTTDEIEQLNLLYIDTSYSNDNILITSLDNIVTTIDVQKELLEDSKEKLSIASQPQLSFSADIDNIYAIPEFKDAIQKFKLGNYILVQYFDDYYVKLRIVGISLNPCMPSGNLSVSFSNFIKSYVEVNDISSLLGLASGNVGSGGSSSGGGSAGTLGNDIDVTLSDTMLSKLVNSETFGTAVTNVVLDTIDVNAITAKYATFGGLNKGTTVIDGKCIQTSWITDQLYNGSNGSITNTTGSIINLEDGKFSFAGGRLKWDGSILYVEGDGTGLDISSNSTVSGLSARITANSDAITTEISDRKNADDGLSTRITQNTTSISTEVEDRKSADNSLSSRITQNATSISTEIEDRKSADSSLSSRITQNTDSITTEVTNRENADNALSSRITQNANSISTEISDRKNADDGLSTRITQNTTSITTEVTNRTNADTALSSRISQTLSGITFDVTNGSTSSTIKLSATKEDGTSVDIASKSITMSGLVTFTNLSTSGQTTIDGGNIKTGYIVSKNYNGSNGSITNTAGSILSLEDGRFNFGGGKIKWDGSTLNVEGSITANTGYIGGTSGFTIASSKMYSNGHSAYNTAVQGVYIGTDYISLGSGGKCWFKSDGTFSLGSGKISYNGSSLTLSSDVTLSWSQITNQPTILTTSDVTTITKNTITTSYVNALDITAKYMTSGCIKSNNYNGTNNDVNNTAGSIINLDDGKFSFDGGKIKYDGSTTTISKFIIKANSITTNTSMTISSTDQRGLCLVETSNNTGINLSGGTAESTIILGTTKVGTILMTLGTSFTYFKTPNDQASLDIKNATITLSDDGGMNDQTDWAKVTGNLIITKNSTSNKYTLKCVSDGIGIFSGTTLSNDALTIYSYDGMEISRSGTEYIWLGDNDVFYGLHVNDSNGKYSDVGATEISLSNGSKLSELGASWTLLKSFNTTDKTGSQAIYYKKIGNIVYLWGTFSYDLGVNQTFATVATLPSGYRPASNSYWLGPSVGATVMRIRISTAGAIQIEWVRNMSNGGLANATTQAVYWGDTSCIHFRTT